MEVTPGSALTIVDPSELEYSSMDQAERGDPVSLIGIRLHILAWGARYDLGTRKAYAPMGQER